MHKRVKMIQKNQLNLTGRGTSVRKLLTHALTSPWIFRTIVSLRFLFPTTENIGICDNIFGMQH